MKFVKKLYRFFEIAICVLVLVYCQGSAGTIKTARSDSPAETAGPGNGPAENAWIQTGGPPGGMVLNVAVDQTKKPEIVFAGMVDGGIYVSRDGGESWEGVVKKADSCADVASSKNAVFAASHNIPLRVSRDHGITWREARLPSDHNMTSMTYSPHGNVLLAQSLDSRVFVSLDDGDSFINVTGNLPGGRISCIAANGTKEYWAGKREDKERRLFHTSDGGKTLKPSTLPQPPASYVSRILVDADDPRLLFIGLSNYHNQGRPPDHDYFWRSRDGGKSWQPIRYPFDPNPGGLPLAQGVDGSLYINMANRLWVSRDQGDSWTKLPFHGLPELMKFGDFSCMGVDPVDPGILYIPTLNGIIKSTDRGATWSLKNEGMVLTSISLIATHPKKPGTVYAASAGGGGTFRSTDFGQQWEWVNQGGLPHPWADELTADPVDADTVYEVVDISDVYRSVDSGKNWKRMWPHFRFSSVDALTVSLSDPHVMYAVKNGFGLFKTTNGGEWWRFLHQSDVDYTYGIAVHPRNPDIVFSGYNPKPFQDSAMVRRSLDGGDSWETVLKIPGSDGVTTVTIDPGDPEIVYAGSVGEEGGQIYRSTDGGSSWDLLNNGFTMCTVWGQPQLVLDPDDPETAFVGTWLAGTWKTTNGARTGGFSKRRRPRLPLSAWTAMIPKHCF